MMQETAEAATYFLWYQELGKETIDYFLILKTLWEENAKNLNYNENG